jgi:ABC-type nickel/cobalt efflux system permease component RcnA
VIATIRARFGRDIASLARHFDAGNVRRPALLLLPLVLAALAFAALRPQTVAAHPLGNFTTNQYVRIEAAPDGLRLVYVLDLAEIPAFREIGERVDADGDGKVSEAESAAYLDAKLAEIVPGLRLSAGGEAVVLTPVGQSVRFPEGQAGLTLLRLEAVFAAPVVVGQDGAADLAFTLDYDTDVLGWREIVVTHGADVRLAASDAPLTDVSDELRAYPDDLLGTPLDRTSAAFTLAAAPGAPAAAGYAAFAADDGPAPGSARPGGGSAGDRFAALLDGGALTPAGAALALLLAMVWGAMHALSPGHGKTVVGAYLVGARGTPRHALYLGLTVTITHTAGVVALGLVTLLLSRYILPEQLYPWLSLTSGLLVAGMGVVLVRQRLTGSGPFGHHHHHHDHGHEHGHHHHHHHGDHDHDHDHEHEHDHGHSHLPPERVTWRNLVALGISGGLVPCPSALVVLLGAIALGRVGFGMLLVVAFSLGLAAALTAVGILFLVAGRYLERRAQGAGSGRALGLALRYAPVAGALGVTAAGLVIVARALDQTRLL